MILAGAASGLVALPSAAADTPSFDASAIDAYLAGEQAASSIPGLAVVVLDRGVRVYERALGKDVDGRPMTLQSPIVIGSVGKSITSLAVRQLVSTGRLALDEPVAHRLPWFTMDAGPQHLDAMTVATLLNHTSGLSTADGQDPRWYEPGLTPEAVARGLGSVRPDRPVGTYEYSNLNFVLLGAIVEAASGQTYADYVDDHVFGPLGMASSSVHRGLQPGPTGFRYLFGVPVPFEEPWPGGVAPAGYHISTADDLARFAGALAAGGAVGGLDIVSGDAVDGTTLALGTDWGPLAGGPGTSSSQSGSTLTTNADLLVAPWDGRAVVVVMNANPTQLLGLPRGAAEIALDTLRLAGGSPTGSPLPSVSSAYLVADAVLVLLAGALGLHVWRGRTWRRRWASRHGAGGRWLAIRTVLADLALPLVVLVGLPLLVGLTGSSRPGDLLGGWRFVAWTLPDLAAALLVLALAPLALGGWKLAMVRRSGSRG